MECQGFGARKNLPGAGKTTPPSSQSEKVRGRIWRCWAYPHTAFAAPSKCSGAECACPACLFARHGWMDYRNIGANTSEDSCSGTRGSCRGLCDRGAWMARGRLQAGGLLTRREVGERRSSISSRNQSAHPEAACPDAACKFEPWQRCDVTGGCIERHRLSRPCT